MGFIAQKSHGNSNDPLVKGKDFWQSLELSISLCLRVAFC